MENTIRKTLLVGFDSRPDWQGKLTAVMRGLVEILGLDLAGEERDRLAELAAGVSNLIYAGALRGIRFEFAGETCEVTLEYFPKDDERDDLDLDMLRGVDLEAENLVVTVLVDDASYAASVGGPSLSEFASEKLTIRLQGAPAGEAEEGGAGGVGDADGGESEDGGAGDSGDGESGASGDADRSKSEDGDSGKSEGANASRRTRWGRVKGKGGKDNGKEN
jgi:hypothetical protein